MQNEQLLERLAPLKKEFETGQARLRELEAERQARIREQREAERQARLREEAERQARFRQQQEHEVAPSDSQLRPGSIRQSPPGPLDIRPPAAIGRPPGY